MKPVILITLHRRYEDLIRNISIINNCLIEFSVSPDIIIIWSTPDSYKQYVIDNLSQKYKNLKFILYRQKLEFEGELGQVTYPESHNIVYGLRFIRDFYKNSYAIVQATDVYPLNGTYKEIDSYMQNDNTAVLYEWHHKNLPCKAFCTHFFATRLNELYWPPMVGYKHNNVLEVQWSKIINKLAKPIDRDSFDYVLLQQKDRFVCENLEINTLPSIKSDFNIDFSSGPIQVLQLNK